MGASCGLAVLSMRASLENLLRYETAVHCAFTDRAGNVLTFRIASRFFHCCVRQSKYQSCADCARRAGLVRVCAVSAFGCLLSSRALAITSAGLCRLQQGKARDTVAGHSGYADLQLAMPDADIGDYAAGKSRVHGAVAWHQTGRPPLAYSRLRAGGSQSIGRDRGEQPSATVKAVVLYREFPSNFCNRSQVATNTRRESHSCGFCPSKKKTNPSMHMHPFFSGMPDALSFPRVQTVEILWGS